jgi:hypothetical protein
LDERRPGDCLSKMFRRAGVPQLFDHAAVLR